jgi:hypothetical protein
MCCLVSCLCVIIDRLGLHAPLTRISHVALFLRYIFRHTQITGTFLTMSAFLASLLQANGRLYKLLPCDQYLSVRGENVDTTGAISYSTPTKSV